MNTVSHFFLNEWYFSAPMTLMSLIGITLVIWRIMLNNSAKTAMDEFLPIFQEVLEKKGVNNGLALCLEEPGIIPRKLFASALETAKLGPAAMKRAMASALELEIIPELNFLLAPILAIAKIATMVGLLGTVFSMINTFSAISDAKDNPTSVTTQAGSIGLALFATAMGLMTAIPLVFMHVLFKDWIARFEAKMKSTAQKFLILYQNINPKLGDEVVPRNVEEKGKKEKGKKEKEKKDQPNRSRGKDDFDDDRDRDDRGRERDDRGRERDRDDRGNSRRDDFDDFDDNRDNRRGSLGRPGR